MNLQRNASVTTVSLSKRNLLTLLNKVDDPKSEKTLLRKTNDGLLIVVAQPDEEHYSDRKPGPLSSNSEAFIEAYKKENK